MQRMPSILAIVLTFLLVGPLAAQDEEMNAAEANPLTEAELDQLVAPIALYPDDLIAEVLMASTYPLEVVQAQRWAETQKDASEEQQTADLEKEEWDPSVKALINFPSVLDMMSERLDWTQNLGDAVLADGLAVMSAIQRLRKKAREAGYLKDSPEQKIVVEPNTENIIVEKEIIKIVPSKPEVIYVPTYNPTVVYGAWPYPAYPPTFYYPRRYSPGAVAFGFVAGIAVRHFWGYAFGDCRWRRGDIEININRNVRFNRHINRNRYSDRFDRLRGSGGGGSGWRHDPRNRRGVRYPSDGVARKYVRNEIMERRDARRDFRGKITDRPSVGGQRPSGINRPSDDRRPSGVNRPSGDRRPADVSRPSGDRRPADVSRPSGNRRPADVSRPAAGRRPAGSNTGRVMPGTKQAGAFGGASGSRAGTQRASDRGRSSRAHGSSNRGRGLRG